MTKPETFGLSDEELARQPTIYAANAFTGKTVLISGGAGGIGRAAAWLFARIGAKVIITGRKAEKLDALTQHLTNAGFSATAFPVDTRDREAVQLLFENIWQHHGPLDILINSAGGQFPMASMDIPAKGWDAVINTNLNGTWNMMQHAATGWRTHNHPGSIVNIVVVTRQGLYGVAHTIAARAGVIGLSQNLAVEWAEHNIRINCIAPGAIETEGWNVYSPQARALYPKSNPMMRVGTTWEIAQACAYLGGPAAGYITGEVLNVAGGCQLWGETWTIEKPDYFKT